MPKIDRTPILNEAVIRAAEIAFRAQQQLKGTQKLGLVEAGQLPRFTKQDLDRLKGACWFPLVLFLPPLNESASMGSTLFLLMM